MRGDDVDLPETAPPDFDGVTALLAFASPGIEVTVQYRLCQAMWGRWSYGKRQAEWHDLRYAVLCSRGVVRRFRGFDGRAAVQPFDWSGPDRVEVDDAAGGFRPAFRRLD